MANLVTTCNTASPPQPQVTLTGQPPRELSTLLAMEARAALSEGLTWAAVLHTGGYTTLNESMHTTAKEGPGSWAGSPGKLCAQRAPHQLLSLPPHQQPVLLRSWRVSLRQLRGNEGHWNAVSHCRQADAEGRQAGYYQCSTRVVLIALPNEAHVQACNAFTTAPDFATIITAHSLCPMFLFTPTCAVCSRPPDSLAGSQAPRRPPPRGPLQAGIGRHLHSWKQRQRQPLQFICVLQSPCFIGL